MEQQAPMIDIKDLQEVKLRLEVPGRVDGVPPVKSQVTRREYLPNQDDVPEAERLYVDVRGGGSNLERIWVQAVLDKVADMREEYSIPDREIWALAQFATFLADRIAGHNLVNAVGEPYPLGLDLAWELGWNDTLAMIGLVNNPPRLFKAPKRETPPDETSSGT